MQFLQNYFNLILLVMIPVFSCFSWIFFRRKGYNYAENIVLQCTIQAQQNTISLVSMTVLYVIGYRSIFQHIIISLLIVIITNSIAYRQFLKSSLAESILKAILVYACSYTIQIIIVAITMVVVVLTM